MNPQEVLERHLEELAPDYTYTIKPMALEVPGWHFFTGSLDDVRDSLFYWVVRDDGSVVTSDPEAELSRIFKTLGVLETPDTLDPQKLSLVALSLLAKRRQLVDAAECQRASRRYKNSNLGVPALKKTWRGQELVFWTKTGGRSPSFTRHVVSIGKKYAVTHTSKTMVLMLK